jgi:hypothetical protein
VAIYYYHLRNLEPERSDGSSDRNRVLATFGARMKGDALIVAVIASIKTISDNFAVDQMGPGLLRISLPASMQGDPCQIVEQALDGDDAGPQFRRNTWRAVAQAMMPWYWF